MSILNGPFVTLVSESPHAASFRSHASWLRALHHLAVNRPWRPGIEPLSELAARSSGQPWGGPPGGAHTVEEALASMRRAWGTELLLTTTRDLAGETDLIRLANSWGVVQAYYVLYGATQALLIAEGQPRPEAHEPTRRSYVDLWVTRRRIQLPPWTFALGVPDSRVSDPDGFRGGPGRPLVTDRHDWASFAGDECWDVAARALMSTRAKHLAEQVEQGRRNKHGARRRTWREEEQRRLGEGRRPRKQPGWWDGRSNLTAAERADIAAKLRPTTLMDHLWRLRVKANYQDEGMFADGPESDDEAAAVANDLVGLVSATLLVHEIRRMHLLGAGALLGAVDDWLARRGSMPAAGLAVRRDLLQRV